MFVWGIKYLLYLRYSICKDAIKDMVSALKYFITMPLRSYSKSTVKFLTFSYSTLLIRSHFLPLPSLAGLLTLPWTYYNFFLCSLLFMFFSHIWDMFLTASLYYLPKFHLNHVPQDRETIQGHIDLPFSGILLNYSHNIQWSTIS